MEEQNTNTQSPAQVQTQIAVPGAVVAFVFGIISIGTCWLGVYFIVPGLIPLIFGILGMIKGKKALKIYDENPGAYVKVHGVFSKIGKILGLIGWILSIVFMLVFVIGLLFIGSKLM